MKRLTERYTNKGIPGVCLKALDNKGNTADSSFVLERLAEFEDFMEEYKFEIIYPKVKILGKTYEDIQELLDKWLKLGCEDKILFAVEQLNKVKEYISGGLAFNTDVQIWFEEYIDKQIKQLKEME